MAEGFGGVAGFAEFTEAEGAVAFGEALAAGIDHQGGVVELGRLEAEGFVEEQLAGGGDEQVLAADDLGHAHGGVVDHHGQFVGGDAVLAPDKEVAEIAQALELAGAEPDVVENDLPIVGHSEAPVDLTGGFGVHAGSDGRAPVFGIDRLGGFVLGVGRLGGAGHVLTGFVAGIDVALVFQALPGFEEKMMALTLDIGSEIAADIGTFVPVAAEPAEVLDGTAGEFGFTALGVEVLFAVEDASAGLAGAFHGDPERAGVAEV